MGLFDRIRDYFNGPAEDEDEDFYEAYDEDFYESARDRDRDEYAGSARTTERVVTNRDNKVVSISATAKLQVVIVKPNRFEEVAEIADHLIEKRTVVLNLEQSGKDISRRIVDFLSGAAYAHNGQLKRIANNTYIITPFNVGLIGADVLGELENNGVFF